MSDGTLLVIRLFQSRAAHASRFWLQQGFRKEMSMLWSLVVLLVILWALGLSFHVAGGLIHILLVIALIAVVFRLVTGRTLA